MGTTNQINANTAGIVTYDGAGNFSADTTTNHNVLVGASSNGITNVAPGAAGTALASNGVSADPSFQAIPGIGVTVTNHATLVGGASNSITSLALGTSGQVLTSNGAGVDPSYQSLPAATGIQTLTDGSANVVSPSGGTITFVNGQNVANLSGSANHITFDVTGTTNHAVQIGNSSGNLTSIATGTSGQALVSGGASADPAFGTLPVNGGGTGAVTLTGVLIGNGTSPVTASTITQYGSLVAGASNAVASVGPGASGTVLASNGLSANPSYQVVPGIGTTVTQHDVLVGGASNNIVSVTPTSNVGWVLASNGTSVDPSFQAVPGVGVTVTNHATLVGGASNSITSLALGSSGQVLTSNGAGADPSYQALPSSVLTVNADSGSATPSGGAITVSGGTSGLTTSASSSTVNLTGTLNVAHGGTGLATMTPYAVLAGGTTSTGNLQQVSGVGSLGQVLTSNGSSTLPTWQTPAAAFIQVNSQVFTSSGTYTPTAGMTYCTVEAIGGGGGGGGSFVSSNNISTGSGGGAGGYARAVFTAAAIGASATVTIGAAGTAGSTGGGTGGTGGTTTFVGSTASISCTGGVGGTGSNADITTGANGGAGGSASCSGQSGNAVLASGQTGGTSWGLWPSSSTGLGQGGKGAASIYGEPGIQQIGRNGDSKAGLAPVGNSFGCGGGGAICANAASAAGGAGSKGIVIITEYIP